MQKMALPPLTQEERAVVANNIRLVEFVISSEFRHAISVKYMSGTDYDDLMQIGSIGLMRAVQLYDASKGAAFSTYAVAWIRQAILRYMHNQRAKRRRGQSETVPVDCAYAREHFRAVRYDLPIELALDARALYDTVNQLHDAMVDNRDIADLIARSQGISLRRIGEKNGCSGEYVRQRTGKAAEMIKNYLGSEWVETYG